MPRSPEASGPTVVENWYGAGLAPLEINSIILTHAKWIVWMCEANKVLPMADVNEIKTLSKRIHDLIGTIK